MLLCALTFKNFVDRCKSRILIVPQVTGGSCVLDGFQTRTQGHGFLSDASNLVYDDFFFCSHFYKSNYLSCKGVYRNLTENQLSPDAIDLLYLYEIQQQLNPQLVDLIVQVSQL